MQPTDLEGCVHLDDVDVLQVCVQVNLTQHLVAVQLLQPASVVHLKRNMTVGLAIYGLQSTSSSSSSICYFGEADP